MQSTITQGNYADATIDNVYTQYDEDGFAAIDPGLYYVDQDTGQVYTNDEVEGDSADETNWVAQGKLLPFVGDQAAPAAPTGLTVTAVTTLGSDGTALVGFQVQWDENSEEDVVGYTLQIDAQTFDAEAGGGAGAWDAATWAYPLVRSFGVGTDDITVGPHIIRAEFVGGTPYDFRLAARDSEGYQSAWSSTVTESALEDGTAPEVPTNVVVTPGFRLLGIRWDKNEERDLWFYQVRIYETALTSSEATTHRTNSSLLIIKDLDPDTEYTVQVRAVDRSGNVATSESDLTGLPFDANPESGWSTIDAASAATPTRVGAADVAFNSVLTSILDSNLITADDIKAGTLNVGYSGQAGTVEVHDSSNNLLATLGPVGMVMVNPSNTSEAMWLRAGSIKFTEAYTGDTDTTTWTTALTPQGLNATAITFGTGEGGANSVPNAGFELASFVVQTESVYTDNTDWSGATSTVNMNVSTTHLTMTAV